MTRMKITTEYPTEDKQNSQNQIFVHFRLILSVYFWHISDFLSKIKFIQVHY
jgi:hypothetical protein